MCVSCLTWVTTMELRGPRVYECIVVCVCLWKVLTRWWFFHQKPGLHPLDVAQITVSLTSGMYVEEGRGAYQIRSLIQWAGLGYNAGLMLVKFLLRIGAAD